MRFTKLELTGELNAELPLHRRMTVVSADGEAERRRLAEALAGRAEGVVWAFDDEDSSEEHVPIEDFAILGLPPHVASAMLLRTHDIPAGAVRPVQPEPVEPDAAEVAALAAEAQAESQVRAELEARRARLAARPAPVAEAATQTAVARALTELRAAEEYAAAATDDAWRIRDEWNELATSLATPGPSDEALAAVDAAREALAQRREELEAARRAVGHGPVSSENAAVIGHLHTEVTNAQARADRPFPGSAARRRLAEAEEAEAKFLQELGFPSYTAYLLDTVINPADPEPLRRIGNAERAVAEAEVAWQNVAPIADELYVHQSLRRQATRLQERAAALLGFDPGNAVVEYLADWPQSYARLTETRTELQRVLAAAGIAPDVDPAATAETWLAARQAEASEYAALEAEVASSEAELAALQRAAADRAARSEARLAEAAQAVRSAEELLDAYLLDRLTAHRSVGPIGSLPLILEDAFADLHASDRMRALTQLAETSATVQVIYVTSDPEILAWAKTVRSDQVAVKHPEAVVPPITPPPAAVPAPAEPVVATAPAPAPFVPPAPAPAPFVAPAPAPAPPAPAPYVPPAPAPAPYVAPAPTPAPPPPPPYVPPAPEPAPYVAPAPAPAPPPPPAPYVAPAPEPAPIEEAPLPTASAESDEPTTGRRCMECRHDLAVGDCHQCRHSFCSDHLVRMKRASRPPLCLSCALVAAGARRGRR